MKSLRLVNWSAYEEEIGEVLYGMRAGCLRLSQTFVWTWTKFEQIWAKGITSASQAFIQCKNRLIRLGVTKSKQRICCVVFDYFKCYKSSTVVSFSSFKAERKLINTIFYYLKDLMDYIERMHWKTSLQHCSQMETAFFANIYYLALSRHASV